MVNTIFLRFIFFFGFGRSIMSGFKPKVLVVSAHAADFCSRAGGTIINYVKAESPVRIIDMTYGERGESNSLWLSRKDLTIEEVKAIRREEAVKAAEILGAEIRFMDFDDNPLTMNRERYEKLTWEIRDFHPTILLTHWINDPLNPDHEVTAKAVLWACVKATDPDEGKPITPNPEIFMFEPSVPTNDLSEFRPDTYIDVTEVFEVKLEALKQFKTQSGLPTVYTQWGAFRARQAVLRHDIHGTPGKRDIKYAEAFKRYTPWTGKMFPLSLEGC